MIEKCDLVILHYKAGFDGSTGKSIYKKKMSVDNLEKATLIKKKSLFLTSLVPLEITTYVNETQTIIW